MRRRTQKIRTQPNFKHPNIPSLELRGWLSSENTYIGIYDETRCLCFLSGYKLYRLAKAIVNHFENPA